MKAITILQPWAQFIALGHKRIETRSWATAYRGILAIHAGKNQELARQYGQAERDAGREPTPMVFGAVVAVARLVNVRRTEFLLSAGLSTKERELGDYSPERFGWMLEDVTPLPEPIVCGGALGLWDLPEKIEEAVSIAVFNTMKVRTP